MRHIFEHATFENVIASFNMNEITFSQLIPSSE